MLIFFFDIERRFFFIENDFKFVFLESEYFCKEIVLIIFENLLKDFIII